MPFRLLRFALSKEYPEPRMFRQPERLRDRYDAVIIGAGGHGLAAAYHLARDYGMTDVAVLEKGYIGGGNTGRNTAIVRSNYLTVEGVKFYDESVRLFSRLSQELDYNLFYSERGHFTLAHTTATLRTMRWRAEVNKHLGVDSDVVTPEEIHRICPWIDLSCGGNAPIVRAVYHPPRSLVPPPGPTGPAAAGRRPSAGCPPRRDRSSATTPSPGPMRGEPIASASRSTRRPPSPASTSGTARSSASGPIVAGSRRRGCSRPWPATPLGSPGWSACARRSSSIRSRPASPSRSSPGSTRSSSPRTSTCM